MDLIRLVNISLMSSAVGGFFHVLVVYLYILCGEISIQILSLLFVEILFFLNFFNGFFIFMLFSELQILNLQRI